MNTIRFSELTLKVLDSFSTINEIVVFNRGNKGLLSIKDPTGNIIVYYDLPESERTDKEYILYDLKSLLNNIKLLKKKELEFVFTENHLVMKDERTQIKWKYAPECELNKESGNIRMDMSKRLNFEMIGKPLFSFLLSKEDFKHIITTVSNLKLEKLKFININNEIVVSSDDSEQGDIKGLKIKLTNNNLSTDNAEANFNLNGFLYILGIFDYEVTVYNKLLYMRAIADVKDSDGNITKKQIDLEYIIPRRNS